MACDRPGRLASRIFFNVGTVFLTIAAMAGTAGLLLGGAAP